MKLLNNILFSLLLGLSRLPFPLLYLHADLLYYLLYYVFRYRRAIVRQNLKDSLPESADLKKIEKSFYRNLCDMFVETLKCMTISEEGIRKMLRCENPELAERYYRSGKSIILVSGHFFNWEILIYSLNLLFGHQAVGVGKKLSNQQFNELTNARRSRFGLKIIHADNIREEFQKLANSITATLFLSDQYPGGATKGYSGIFLNKPSYFLYGAEKYARDYNFPVIYASFERTARGRYKIHLTEIAQNPKDTEYGFIMEEYIRLLEQNILKQPDIWLWSHKRWKNIENYYRR